MINAIVALDILLYNELMRRNKRNPWWLALGLISLAGLVIFSNLFPPEKTEYLIIFFLTVLLSGFFLSFCLLNNVRRAILISLGVVIWLILRYSQLRQPFYIVLLVTCLLSLELLFASLTKT